MSKHKKALEGLVRAGNALRQTAVVDDDFPEMLDNFDMALRAGTQELLRANRAEASINDIAAQQYAWVEQMGWHNKTVLEALALIASEVGEAVNECRGEKPTADFATELADIILRVADLAHWQGIDLAAVIAAKMALNAERGTRGRSI